MKKVIFPIILIILLVGIYPTFNECNRYSDIKAVKGVLNLSNYNFLQNGNIKIKGEWELYPNKLLKPEQLRYEKVHNYLDVPEKLTDQLDGRNTGYMTMHLKIFLPKEVPYGFRMEGSMSASKIWVNSILQEQIGRVGKSYEKEKAIYLPSYVYFIPQNGVADIVVQASNYTNLNPLLKPIELGLKDKIMNKFILNASVDLIIIGGLFIVELLFLCLYKFLKNNNKVFLYFSILCLFIQLRCLFLNERIIVHLFPNMPFELLSKTAAITYYLYIPIYILFLKELFSDLPKKLINVSLYFSIPFTIICIVTNDTFYDRLAFISEVILAIITIKILIFLIKKVKEEEGIISLIAFIVLISTAINDILINNGMIYGRYGFQVGMFIFAFLEVYIIIVKYSREIINAENIKLENKIIYEKSIKDDLTNLYKRNYIQEILTNAMKKYVDEKETFSIIMFDIDHFKDINDTYGHLFGDEVLSIVSNIIKNSIRNTDYAGRYGGEEFIIILPNTKQQNAMEIAERIRVNVSDFLWENDMKITISGGLYENKVYSNIECVKNADDLLYKAKKDGRNTIVV